MNDPEEQQNDTAASDDWQSQVGGLNVVEGSLVRIWRDQFRRLRVEIKGGTEQGGTEHVDVKPARVFPISGAADFISFLDRNDKEVLLLKDLEELDPESRETLEEEISRTYFVPKITYIYDIEDSHGAARWEVETDRGYRIFDVRDREDVRVVGGRRVLLQDADGNRFEIEDLWLLDPRSQRLVDKEV